jgi:hypothetical protein
MVLRIKRSRVPWTRSVGFPIIPFLLPSTIYRSFIGAFL